jgi:hypothetical protein
MEALVRASFNSITNLNIRPVQQVSSKTGVRWVRVSLQKLSDCMFCRWNLAHPPRLMLRDESFVHLERECAGFDQNVFLDRFGTIHSTNSYGIVSLPIASARFRRISLCKRQVKIKPSCERRKSNNFRWQLWQSWVEFHFCVRLSAIYFVHRYGCSEMVRLVKSYWSSYSWTFSIFGDSDHFLCFFLITFQGSITGIFQKKKNHSEKSNYQITFIPISRSQNYEGDICEI